MSDDTRRPPGPRGPDRQSDASRPVPDESPASPLASENEAAAQHLLDSFPPVEPDPSVWQAIATSIAADREESGIRSGSRSGHPRFLRDGFIIAAAAVFLVAIVTAVTLASTLTNETVAVGTTTIELSDPQNGGSVMTVVTNDNGTSVASTSQLPELTSAETYQLWAVVGDEIVSVGLLGTDPDGAVFRLEAEPAVLALTVEQAGGVAVSEVPPVAVWQRSG